MCSLQFATWFAERWGRTAWGDRRGPDSLMASCDRNMRNLNVNVSKWSIRKTSCKLTMTTAMWDSMLKSTKRPMIFTSRPIAYSLNVLTCSLVPGTIYLTRKRRWQRSWEEVSQTASSWRKMALTWASQLLCAMMTSRCVNPSVASDTTSWRAETTPRELMFALFAKLRGLVEAEETTKVDSWM